jgi:hypothetical protein
MVVKAFSTLVEFLAEVSSSEIRAHIFITEELDSEGVSEFLSLLEGDLPFRLKIILVADEHLDHGFVGVLVNL